MRLELNSIKDLPDLHRMGHTCANLNGELLFIWGGTDERATYLPTSRNNHLWIFETLTGYCRHRTCSGECPPHLSGATSALIGRKMYVFGGHSIAQDNCLNSLYCLDLESFVWTDLGVRAKGEPTKPIRSDKCTSWSYGGRLYVFGGYGWSQVEHLLQLLDRQQDLQLTPDFRWPKLGWNNQLVEFNPADNTWRWPSYTGKCPSARAAHSGTLMGNKYYLFGGRDCRARLNDLYILDMSSLNWIQVTVNQVDHLERPIRHLLEDVGDAEEEEEADDNQLVMDDMQEAMVEEELTPSPSASAQPNDGDAEFRNNSTYGLVVYDNDNDDEDDDSSTFEYPHPSHLLEHWSLLSHQSTSSSSAHFDNPNNYCLQPYPEQPELLQEPDSRRDSLELNLQSPVQPASLNDHEQPNQEEPVDTESERLKYVEPPSLPTGRSFSSFTPISDQEIMLYGGVSSQDANLDDCWLFDTKLERWTQIDLKYKQPRLWHTGSRTKNNEVIILGGFGSETKIEEFCTDMITISLEPKSLKRLALDSAARSIRMRDINRVRGLPSAISKLIKLRKQAMAVTTTRRYQRSTAVTVVGQAQ